MNPSETNTRQFGTAGGILVSCAPSAFDLYREPADIVVILCLAFSRLSDNDFMSYLQSPLSCLKNILVGEVIPLSLGR